MILLKYSSQIEEEYTFENIHSLNKKVLSKILSHNNQTVF